SYNCGCRRGRGLNPPTAKCGQAAIGHSALSLAETEHLEDAANGSELSGALDHRVLAGSDEADLAREINDRLAERAARCDRGLAEAGGLVQLLRNIRDHDVNFD